MGQCTSMGQDLEQIKTDVKALQAALKATEETLGKIVGEVNAKMDQARQAEDEIRGQVDAVRTQIIERVNEVETVARNIVKI